jgi:murein DD-endopeptidase MepM/ murein hydrolase activator NlpD
MATNTHIRIALLALALAGGALAGKDALPTKSLQAAGARQTSAQQSHPYSYGWPVKPFDQQHPVRGNFADPRSHFHGEPTMHGLMHGRCSCSYHAGIDISVPDLTPVYPVRSGVVRAVTWQWVEVDSGDGMAFQYWHIDPQVKVGDDVHRNETILGRVMKGNEHVHLTQLQDGQPVNPLAPGGIGPYIDTTKPTVREISFRRGDTGPELMPEFVTGRVEIIVSASDEATMPVPGKWRDMPVTPAKLAFRITRLVPQRRTVVPEMTALNVTRSLPGPNMWQTYARGTRQNFVPFDGGRAWYQPGVYLFKLASGFNTKKLANGVYALTVTAWDADGNQASGSQRFSVHNHVRW